MNQTARNIKRYKSMLPKMRDRVIAMVAMLAIASSLMVSVSFAWVTLSRNPEVSGLATTITGNGSLEIALADKDGAQPGDTQIGDSVGTFLGYEFVGGGYGFSDNELDYAVDANGNKIPVYRTTTDSNLTWGNLINLSDPAYGLDKLELRPAQLNDGGDLLKRPIFAVTYGSDGRVDDYFDESNFGYTSYDKSQNSFVLVPHGTGYGVRAISSLVYDSSTATSVFSEFVRSVRQVKSKAEGNYKSVFAEGSPYIGTMSSMVESYANLEISNGDPDTMDCNGYLNDLKAMAKVIQDAYEMLGQTYCGIAELQRFINGTTDIVVEGDERISYDDYYYTVDDLCSLYYNNYTKKATITADQLAQLKSDTLSDADRATLTATVEAQIKSALLEHLVEAYTDENITRTYTDKKGNFDQTTLDAIAEARTLLSAENDAALTAKSKALLAAFLEDELAFTSDLYSYAADRASLKVQVDYITSLSSAMWSDISYTVDYLVDTKSCKIGEYKISELKALVKNDIFGAIDMLNGSTAYITNGLLKRIDNQLARGYHLDIPEITIKVTYGVSLDVSARVVTTATTETAHDDYNKYRNYADFEATDGKAEDTYAMALDFWVRTNKDGCFLTLEGEFLRDNAGNIVGYVGANRIWDELTPDMYASTNSLYTTQGSGSCYVFSCKAEDYDRTIGLLGSMKIAFVDASGDMVAMAKLDTSEVWANSGRYTVPLVLDDVYSKSTEIITGYRTVTRHYDSEGNRVNGQEDADGNITYYYTDEDGVEHPAVGEVTAREEQIAETKEVQYIASLTKNEAMWLTAVIYLDGEAMTNDQVMAATGIEGKLNIQFGDTAYLDAAEDKVLYEQTITVAASANKSVMDFEDADLGAAVTVEVASNSAPSVVEAYFYRQITSQQGVRQKKITFTKTADAGESSTWTGSYTFDTPGAYQLAFITVDGREYELEEPVIITVNGYALGSVDWTNNPGQQSISMFSGNATGSAPVTLSFATDAQTLSGVRGLFVSEEGNQVSVTFNNVNGVSWEGNATFRKSGTYTLKTVYYSGVSPQGVSFKNEEYPVPTEDQISVTATLGVTASVYLSSEAFNPPNVPTFALKDEWAEGADVGVIVILTDDQNERLEDLGKGMAENYLVLTYASNTGAKTLDTNLKWSPQGYYYGTFEKEHITAGIFNFNRVEIGSSLITNATAAPTLTVISPIPPSYYGNDLYEIDGLTEQLAPGGVAYMAADIASSSSAIVRMNVYNADKPSETYTIYGMSYAPADGNNKYSDFDATINGEEQKVTRWIFELRKGTGTPWENNLVRGEALEGNWKMSSLEISQFYDKDSTYYDPALDQWKVLVSNDSSFDVKAITKIHVNLEYIDPALGTTTTLGSSTAPADFMSTLTLSGLKFSVADFEGQPIGGGVLKPVLSYTFTQQKDSTGNPWYSLQNGTLNGSFRFEGNRTDGAHFTFGDANNQMVFSYGGSYSGRLTFELDGFDQKFEITGSGTLDSALTKGEKFMAVPQVSITWARPVLEIAEGTSEGKVTENLSDSDVNLVESTNYWDKTNKNYAYLGFAAKKGLIFYNYDAPTVVMALSNSGLATSSTAVLPLEGERSNTFTFSAGNKDASGVITASSTVGSKDSNSLGNEKRYGTERGKDTIKTLSMTDGTNTYTVTLAKPVKIVVKTNQGDPKLVYQISDGKYVDLFSVPPAVTYDPADSSNKTPGVLSVKLEAVDSAIRNDVPRYLDHESEGVTTTTTTNETYFQTSRTTTGCNPETLYTPYKRTVTTVVYENMGVIYNRVTYEVVGWKIDGVEYSIGAEYPVDVYSGTVVAEAVVKETWVATRSEYSTCTHTTYLDTKLGDEATTNPGYASGTVKYETETTIKDCE